ncbi:MAG: amino acid adenylation protein, partial [Ornithinibacter sp.]
SGDLARTFDPPKRLVVARALVESSRVIPWMIMSILGLGVLTAFELIRTAWGWGVAAAAAGLIMLAAGLVAALVTTLAKWLLVGRFKESQHPLWSSFVWRNELADTFVEVVAAPWFARAATGTAVLNTWLRAMGSRIGRGVWCETYWLPEADLIDLRAGATVGRGCVVQTHLFHDRILSMDRVTIADGGTLGPNSVILPAARIGRHATVGPVSLVMRGESVPDKTRWIGNPVGPWTEDE